MKEFNPKLTIGIFSALVGILFASQVKMNIQMVTPVTISSIQRLEIEVKSLKTEIDDLKLNIDDKQNYLALIEDSNYSDDNIISVLEDERDKNMLLAGYKTVEGPGIEIVMFDNIDSDELSFDFNDGIIHDVDMQNILNDLRVAGAEAISINGERVLSFSDIKCAGPVIRVNGRSLGTPFIITAIGDPKLLMAAISAPGTYAEMLTKVYGIGIQPYSKDKLVIPAYSGDFSYSYAKTVQ
ncbi:DUF881 domain-containing protein [Soehngenia longivitae]|uniref:DUF881 domain-containing protein n=1 Tax=Soehngenia longivitae TaxID=2562294 RepID=A0A4Z0D3V5_9FIRM|nr:DUF881 domain-containing protein [Soehngenia longivitae]TFZ40098.1 DUF881 domain-containing protein [Soehngenia longivitae]